METFRYFSDGDDKTGAYIEGREHLGAFKRYDIDGKSFLIGISMYEIKKEDNKSGIAYASKMPFKEEIEIMEKIEECDIDDADETTLRKMKKIESHLDALGDIAGYMEDLNKERENYMKTIFNRRGWEDYGY